MGYRFFNQSPESQDLQARREAAFTKIRDRGVLGQPASERPGFHRLELMRRLIARKRLTARPKAGLPATPAAAVITLNRLAFGPRPGEIAAFQALGGNDEQRLSAWLDQQLAPGSIDDSAADARLAQAGFVTQTKSVSQLWSDHIVNSTTWEETIRPIQETERATFLRCIHSKRQLYEVMVDFWHNHFNVYGWDYPIVAIWPHTDRDAIRPHALGNFRQMLESVVRTPAMLFYLDNFLNSQEDANENFAREFLELHTLGAAAYYGSLPPDQVPVDGNGQPLGYVEDDVIAAARCLTGWTIRDRDWDPDFGSTGEFFYYDPWHDHAPKHLLGLDLPANQPPMKDGLDLLDLVASHPATARHIATKLARRLLGDFPPAAVVDAAAQVFQQASSAPDQIAQTVRSIVESPQFLTTFGDKVKRPLEIAVGAFRALGGDLPFTINDDATDYFFWVYRQTGQPLFAWHPPNGYPDFKAAWNSTAPRVRGWRLGNFFVQLQDDNGNFYFDVLSQVPAGVRSAEELVDFFTQRILGRQPPDDERDQLIDFMAQGHNPTFDLPVGTDEWTQDRVRTLVAIILMIPSYLWR